MVGPATTPVKSTSFFLASRAHKVSALLLLSFRCCLRSGWSRAGPDSGVALPEVSGPVPGAGTGASDGVPNNAKLTLLAISHPRACEGRLCSAYFLTPSSWPVSALSIGSPKPRSAMTRSML